MALAPSTTAGPLTSKTRLPTPKDVLGPCASVPLVRLKLDRDSACACAPGTLMVAPDDTDSANPGGRLNAWVKLTSLPPPLTVRLVRFGALNAPTVAAPEKVIEVCSVLKPAVASTTEPG